MTRITHDIWARLTVRVLHPSNNVLGDPDQLSQALSVAIRSFLDGLAGEVESLEVNVESTNRSMYNRMISVSFEINSDIESEHQFSNLFDVTEGELLFRQAAHALAARIANRGYECEVDEGTFAATIELADEVEVEA